jgi:hypothetical protein
LDEDIFIKDLLPDLWSKTCDAILFLVTRRSVEHRKAMFVPRKKTSSSAGFVRETTVH